MTRYIGYPPEVREQGQDRIDEFIRLAPVFDILLKILELALKYFGW